MPNSFGSPVPLTPSTPTTPIMGMAPAPGGHASGFKGRPENIFPYFVENANAVPAPFSEYPYNDFVSPPNSRMSSVSIPDDDGPKMSLM